MSETVEAVPVTPVESVLSVESVTLVETVTPVPKPQETGLKARCLVQQCTSAKLLTKLPEPGIEQESVEVLKILKFCLF